MESFKITIGDKIIVLSYQDWDTDINLDDITKIDYSNLYGELVTVSALLNRVGILKADIDNEYEHAKLDLSIFEAQKAKEVRRQNTLSGTKISNDAVLENLNIDSEIIAKRRFVINLRKNCSYIDSLYWSIQSKDKKLSVLMKGVTPEEFSSEIIEGTINTFKINKIDKLYSK